MADDDITALARSVLSWVKREKEDDFVGQVYDAAPKLAEAVLELHAETREQDEMLIQAYKENAELREQLNQVTGRALQWKAERNSAREQAKAAEEERNELIRLKALPKNIPDTWRRILALDTEVKELREQLKQAQEGHDFLSKSCLESVVLLQSKLKQAQEGWERVAWGHQERTGEVTNAVVFWGDIEGNDYYTIPLYRRKGDGSMPRSIFREVSFGDDTDSIPTPDKEGGDAELQPNYTPLTQGRTGGESQGLVTDEMAEVALRRFYKSVQGTKGMRKALEAVVQDIYQAGYTEGFNVGLDEGELIFEPVAFGSGLYRRKGDG